MPKRYNDRLGVKIELAWKLDVMILLMRRFLA